MVADITPAAQEKNIPVWGEIELFAQALAHLKQERGYAPKVIAITGTNGKTTVTTLTGLLCERAGLTTRVAGNISPAALDVLREVLDADELPQALRWLAAESLGGRQRSPPSQPDTRPVSPVASSAYRRSERRGA